MVMRIGTLQLETQRLNISRLKYSPKKIAATLFTFAGTLMTTLVITGAPVMAAPQNPYCTHSGHRLCIGTTSVTAGTSVLSVSRAHGRNINVVPVGPNVKLHFAAKSSLCVGINNAGYVTARSCTGPHVHVTWLEDYVNGANKMYLKNVDTGLYLASTDLRNTPLLACGGHGHPSCHGKFRDWRQF